MNNVTQMTSGWSLANAVLPPPCPWLWEKRRGNCIPIVQLMPILRAVADNINRISAKSHLSDSIINFWIFFPYVYMKFFSIFPDSQTQKTMKMKNEILNNYDVKV